MTNHIARSEVFSLWTAALMTAGLGGLGCDRDEAVEPEVTTPKTVEQTAPTVEDVSDEPAQYYGERLTVTGEVDEVYGPRGFVLEGSGGIFDDEIPVLTRSDVRVGGVPLEDDDEVIVTGTVRRFVVTDIEREVGWDLDQEIEVAMRDKPVLVAESIRRVEEAARWSESEPEGVLVGTYTIVTAVDPDALVGQRVEVPGIQVQSTMGKGLWVGESHTSQLFVAPAAGTELGGLSRGDRVDVTGMVRRMPAAAEAIRQWDLPAALRQQIQEEPLYIEATRIQRSADQKEAPVQRRPEGQQQLPGQQQPRGQQEPQQQLPGQQEPQQPGQQPPGQQPPGQQQPRGQQQPTQPR